MKGIFTRRKSRLDSRARVGIPSRILISFLLLTAVIPVLAWIPFADGQSLTTFTVTSTSTETQSMTVTTTHMSAIAGAQLSIRSTYNTAFGCIFDNLPFTIVQGESIIGGFVSSSTLDFYILSDSVAQDWIKSGSCDAPQPVWLKEQQVTSYTVPGSDTELGLVLDPGQYDVLFINFSHDTTASVNFNLQIKSSATFTSVQEIKKTFAAATVKAQACSDITCLITQNSLMIGALAGVIIVIAAALRRRSAASTGSTAQVSAPATHSPTTQPQTQAKYCPDCAQQMRYVEQYNSWWCDNCNQYKDQI